MAHKRDNGPRRTRTKSCEHPPAHLPREAGRRLHSSIVREVPSSRVDESSSSVFEGGGISESSSCRIRSSFSEIRPTKGRLAQNTPESRGGAAAVNPETPDPQEKGPLDVCSVVQYSFHPVTNPTRTYYGKYFVPGVLTPAPPPLQLVCVQRQKYPLVVIIHARGASHDSYDLLAEHIASHGFVVCSMNRGLATSWNNDTGDILEETVHFMYTSSGAKYIVTDDVSIFAHSSGGSVALEYGYRVATPEQDYEGKVGRTLRSVLLLAPSMSPADGVKTISGPSLMKLNKLITDSLLIIISNGDNDSGAYPATPHVPGIIQETGFKYYDILGWSDYNHKPLYTKDFVFLNQPEAHHFIQNYLLVRAYVAAALLRDVYAYKKMSVHFRGQIPPLDIPQPFQQHMDAEHLSIVDFDYPLDYVANYEITESSVAISIDRLTDVDGYSPHATKALIVNWSRTSPPASLLPSYVRLVLSGAVDIASFSLFSFRAAIRYTDGEQFERILRIRLNGTHGPETVVTVRPPVATYNNKLLFVTTRDPLSTYTVPLSAFKGLNKSPVSSIEFDFSLNKSGPSANAVFYIDSVQFWLSEPP